MQPLLARVCPRGSPPSVAGCSLFLRIPPPPAASGSCSYSPAAWCAGSRPSCSACSRASGCACPAASHSERRRRKRSVQCWRARSLPPWPRPRWKTRVVGLVVRCVSQRRVDCFAPRKQEPRWFAVRRQAAAAPTPRQYAHSKFSGPALSLSDAVAVYSRSGGRR